MTSPQITSDDLGAWVLRCNSGTWGSGDYFKTFQEFYDSLDGSLGRTIHDWRVDRNQRSRMMAPGEKVLLWVYGDGSGDVETGFWGGGHVRHEPHDALPESYDEQDEENGGPSGWIEQARDDGVDNQVDVTVEVFEEVLSDTELRAAGIEDLEVQTHRQGPNPSWVSKEQLSLLGPLLREPWPDPADDIGDEIVIDRRSAGFGTWWQDLIVETAAMQVVTSVYTADGWTVANVSYDDNVGWGLTCTRKKETARVAVKGVSGDRPSVLLTVNEHRAAETEKGWVLAVVTRAVSAPELHRYSGEQTASAGKPYLYLVDLSGD